MERYTALKVTFNYDAQVLKVRSESSWKCMHDARVESDGRRRYDINIDSVNCNPVRSWFIRIIRGKLSHLQSRFVVAARDILFSDRIYIYRTIISNTVITVFLEVRECGAERCTCTEFRWASDLNLKFQWQLACCSCWLYVYVLFWQQWWGRGSGGSGV